MPHDPTWGEFLGRAALALLTAGVFIMLYLAYDRWRRR